jgi:putative hydrolase of the HAD superfamily
MRKLFFYAFTLFASLGFSEVVVFDFGGVMTFDHDRTAIVQFLCDSFSFTSEEFDQVNGKKRDAVKAGQTDEEFWLQYAKDEGISLPANWTQEFVSVIRNSLNVNPAMYQLVEELKERETSVGLLSNIDHRLAELLRKFGCYEPFDPCILSYEIQIKKPDPKAYEYLLETLGTPAEEVVFIDDKIENVEAALKLGIDAIHFQSAEQIREELSARGLL